MLGQHLHLPLQLEMQGAATDWHRTSVAFPTLDPRWREIFPITTLNGMICVEQEIGRMVSSFKKLIIQFSGFLYVTQIKARPGFRRFEVITRVNKVWIVIQKLPMEAFPNLVSCCIHSTRRRAFSTVRSRRKSSSRSGRKALQSLDLVTSRTRFCRSSNSPVLE